MYVDIDPDFYDIFIPLLVELGELEETSLGCEYHSGVYQVREEPLPRYE